MNVEKTIVEMHGMLVKILGTLDEHSKMHQEHRQTLQEHGRILEQHTKILGSHSEILGSHSQILENHSSQLKEHGQILNALRSGQEHLKAELDGMKISNAKEIGNLKETNETLSVNQELLRDESWTTRVDVERIKKTMGMA